MSQVGPLVIPDASLGYFALAIAACFLGPLILGALWVVVGFAIVLIDALLGFPLDRWRMRRQVAAKAALDQKEA